MKSYVANRWMMFLLLMAAVLGLHSQTPEMSIQKDDIPFFYADVTTFASESEGQPRLVVDTRIAYDELQFMSVEDAYQAEYEVSVSVFDERGELKEDQMATHKVYSQEYEITNLRSLYDLTRMEFIVSPGQYNVDIIITDKDSKKSDRRKVGISVPDYAGETFALSSMILADRIERSSLDGLDYVPNVMKNYDTDQEVLFLVFEVYHPEGLGNVPVAYRIQNQKNKTLRRQAYTLSLKGKRTVEAIEIRRDDLSSGRYRLVLDIGEERNTIRRDLEFSIRWIGMPMYATDLDLAVEQLRYIIRGKALRKMKRAGNAEKEMMFREFWKASDQTPSTQRNEVMEEYYRRIQYANESFGTYRDGWQTDLGMVYVLLGPPDDIERHPFDQGSKPYQVWRYYRINRGFVFIDETGFGEYRLRSPSSFWQAVNELR